MSSCTALRVGVAAVVAYSIGALAGSTMFGWVLAVAAVVGMVLWLRRGTRRLGGTCGTESAPSRHAPAAARTEPDAEISRVPED